MGRRPAQKGGLQATASRERREFVSTLAKDYVRSVIDRPVIDRFKKAHYPHEGMAFLGLTGEQLNDILSWREYFTRWTAVQVAATAEQAEVADELERRVLRNNLELNFQYLRADIDELLSRSDGAAKLRWPYQVINLDYYGGLINAGKDGSAERLNALRALFQHQPTTAFLLFLTISFRGDDGGEMEKVIRQEEEDLVLTGMPGVVEAFSQHRELGRPGLLKLYVPLFLASVAPRHRLTFPAVLRYRGTVPMMHFAIECDPYTETQANRHLSLAERIEVVNRPLIVVDEHGHESVAGLAAIG